MKLTKCKLGELVNVTRGMSLSGQYYSEKGELIRLTLGNFNMNGGGFKKNTSKSDLYFTGPVREEFILKKGDIITPLTEQSLGLLGTTARIPESGKYIQSQDVALVKCKPGKIDPNFCYYLVSSHSVKQQLSAAAQQTKIRHTSPEKIMNCTVWVPELQEQERIGALLTAIDSKIELNCSINRNLEALAKQLYDYWFVQFDFPDENGRPYKSSGGKMVWNEVLKREAPEGWKVYSLAELGCFKNGINYSKDEIGDKDYKIVNVRNISSSSIFIDNSGLDVLTLKRNGGDNYLVKESDILIARSGVPGATRLLRDVENNIIYCGFIICYSISNIDNKPILFYTLKQLESVTKSQSNGSILSNISQDVLKQLCVVLPDIKVKGLFNEMINKVFSLIQNNQRMIDNLIKQRDELLPLLMNGQVTIE